MASAQYLQAFNDIRSMQQQRVAEKLREQSASKKSFAGMSQATRPMAETTPRPEMGPETTGIISSKTLSKVGSAGLILGAAVVSNYVSNIGFNTSNKAAQNATNNFLAKSGFAAATGYGVFKAASAGAALAGPVGAAIGAAGALAISALTLSTENNKLLRRLEENNAQSAKDSQRLGYITYSRGR